MTDQIGGRVILYYADDVDPVADLLSTRLSVDARRSVDKRRALGLRQFGYRSVHLVATASAADQVRFPALKARLFEVQIRSVLEHAWAEIEHEVIYKSGVRFPLPVTRRFSAVAATLEMLDDQFLQLRAMETELRGRYEKSYLASEDQDVEFDAARLSAFMSVSRPANPGWAPSIRIEPAIRGTEPASVDGLRVVGLSTPRSFRAMLESARMKRAIESIAAARGIAPSDVSHYAMVLLAIGLSDRGVLEDHFPGEADDPSLSSAI